MQRTDLSGDSLFGQVSFRDARGKVVLVVPRDLQRLRPAQAELFHLYGLLPVVNHEQNLAVIDHVRLRLKRVCHEQVTPLRGQLVRVALGPPVGLADGSAEGCLLGCPLGVPVGCTLGCLVGSSLGCAEGCPLGSAVGSAVGVPVGCALGQTLGSPEGSEVG